MIDPCKDKIITIYDHFIKLQVIILREIEIKLSVN
jgi:hypothetical protein